MSVRDHGTWPGSTPYGLWHPWRRCSRQPEAGRVSHRPVRAARHRRARPEVARAREGEDRNSASANKRRIHFLLELGFRILSAVQGFGRSHRTNQLTPPVYRPLTTDCRGERRFLSTIIRGLEALGALTRGQRQTGSQNLFDSADNLESEHARDALREWFHLLYRGKLRSVSLEHFQAMTGLVLCDEAGQLLERLPPIYRWLNRILALRIATQNMIFEEFLGLVEDRIEAARAAGTLDLGIETIRVKQVTVLSDELLRKDP